LEAWRERLAGRPAVLELPTDRPRPVVPSGGGAVVDVVVPPEVAVALGRLTRRHGATLFMVLLGAFETLLARYTGQEDILVGTPVANRGHLELEDLIGFFVNTLVLRGDLSGNPTFLELLGRVREDALSAYAHQDLPFEKLVAALAPERDSSHHPLAQVLIALQNAPTSELDLGAGLTATLGELHTATAKLDLSLLVGEPDGWLAGNIEYSTDLFDASTLQRMSAHFTAIFVAVAADPRLRLQEIELLSAAERLEIAEWSTGRAPQGDGETVHELVARRAEIAPDDVAVETATERLTYLELDRRANRLAHHLRAHGVGPEVPVGVCLDRSAELIVALLAILKAGGAYVPLDADFPAERLAFMLADSGARLLLTERPSLARFAAVPDAVVRLVPAEEGEAIARRPEDAPASLATADNLAYLVYTSGSTRRPKGVAIPHRGVIRLVGDRALVRLGPGDALPQLAPVSLDASTLEIWGCLVNGARLVVPPPGQVSLAELALFVEQHRVTVLHLTSTLFQQMAEGPVERLRGVRELLASGDVVPAEAVRHALAALPATRLSNCYGPTEN
ncbi:MAG TPA: AMP-binding protein, partial [Thermoanaerobaculia bacterium]